MIALNTVNELSPALRSATSDSLWEYMFYICSFDESGRYEQSGHDSGCFSGLLLRSGLQSLFGK